MNVKELRHLSIWYTGHYRKLNTLYSALLQPIQHNANQPSKQPVEDQLEKLLEYLHGMTFEELSLQELSTLADVGVSHFIGMDGARFVDGLVRTANYDPNTATSKLNEAMTAVSNANSHFTAYLDATSALGFDIEELTDEPTAITIRVGFRNDASIENLTNWKDSAKDWYDIVRGVAMAAGEAPEDTKVVGASTGSIILILAATVTVTGLLALISKNVASVAKDVVGIAGQIEDLRAKKWLNKAMETELKKLQQEKKDNARTEIMAAIKAKLPGMNGEQESALETSVKKLLTFNEKGGNVDFVAPESDEELEEDGAAHRDELAEVRAIIHEYQAAREQTKLLEDQSKRQA